MASQQMEQLKRIMRQMMQMEGMPSFRGPMDHLKLRQNIERSQNMMFVEPKTAFTKLDLNGVEGEVCIPTDRSYQAVVIYLHGGGLICGTAESSRGYASLIASETGYITYSLSYRLAPEHPFPAAVDDCLVAYGAVLARHPEHPIFLIGESGGGYLCLTTVLKAREAGLRLPSGIVPYSPVVDMCGILDRTKTAPNDFTLSPNGLSFLQELYAPNESSTNLLVSPVFADFRGFPPMFLAWDESELLAIDSLELMNRARSAGVIVEGKGYPDCFHAFATTGKGTPESLEVLHETVSFMKRHLSLTSK